MSIDTGHSEPIAPVVVAQRRQRDLGLPRFAVAQDQEASSGHTFRQHIAAQGCGGQRRKPRVQRGEDGFAGGGHGLSTAMRLSRPA